MPIGITASLSTHKLFPWNFALGQILWHYVVRWICALRGEKKRRRKKHFLHKIGSETSESLSKQDLNVLFRTKVVSPFLIWLICENVWGRVTLSHTFMHYALYTVLLLTHYNILWYLFEQISCTISITTNNCYLKCGQQTSAFSERKSTKWVCHIQQFT